MKITSPVKNTILFAASFTFAASAFAGDRTFQDREDAKVIAARHLIALIDRPELARVVSAKKLSDDAYWQNMFNQAGRPSLYSMIEKDLKGALTDIPIVDGAPAKPALVAKLALRGLSPLPFVPVADLPPNDQRRVIAFATGALKRFSSTIYSSSRDFDAAIADVALAAGDTFHSSLISEGFNRLGSASLDVRLREKETELIDEKDKLNDLLHVWGLHLVINGEKLEAGKLNLSAYLIDKAHVYTVERVPFPMYEVQPVVEHEFYPALGHAEIDQGFLILFAQTINKEVESTSRYLSEGNLSFLRPSPSLSSTTIQAIDALVRDGVSASSNLRDRFVDTVGHHEGFHKYIEPTLAESVRRGYFSEREKLAHHETGAYLYQLESSDPHFTPLDLMLILSTSQDASAGYANHQGAAQAIRRLQRALGFGDDVIMLFKAPATAVRKAAAYARQHYEIEVRNGGAQ